MKVPIAFLPLLLLGAAGCGPGPVPVEQAEHYPGDGHDHSGADEAEAHGPDDGHGHGPVGRAAMPNDEIHAGMKDPSAVMPTPEDPHGLSAGAAGVPHDDYAGVVRLSGELATQRDAFLFVSVMPAGSNVPSGFDRFELGNEAVGERVDGQRVISFSYKGCAVPEGDVELKVQFDTDGYVETKDEHSVTERFPVTRGDTAIDVVLARPSE